MFLDVIGLFYRLAGFEHDAAVHQDIHAGVAARDQVETAGDEVGVVFDEGGRLPLIKKSLRKRGRKKKARARD